MLCENCGRNEANVKYTQIINGVKKQMTLCDECAKQLGIEDINFNMPISFSNFLGDFFDEYETDSLIPNIIQTKELKCPKCNMNYNEFLENGKFGCDECYEIFKEKIDSIIKNIHGANVHNGRIGKFLKDTKDIKSDNDTIKKETTQKIEQKDDILKDKIEKLKIKLKQEIKDEKYEEAAKTRDEIKKLEK